MKNFSILIATAVFCIGCFTYSNASVVFPAASTIDILQVNGLAAPANIVAFHIKGMAATVWMYLDASDENFEALYSMLLMARSKVYSISSWYENGLQPINCPGALPFTIGNNTYYRCIGISLK
jgi:hypothetical protein